MIPELSSRLLTRQISPSSLWSRGRLYLTPFTCAVVPVLPAQQNRISSVNMFSHTITCLQPLQLQWAPQCAQVLWESVVWLWAVAHVRSTGPSVLTLKSQQPPLPTHTHTHTHTSHTFHLTSQFSPFNTVGSLPLSLFLSFSAVLYYPAGLWLWGIGQEILWHVRGGVLTARRWQQKAENQAEGCGKFSGRARTHTHTRTHTLSLYHFYPYFRGDEGWDIECSYI